MRRIDPRELISAAEARSGTHFPTTEFVEPLERFVDSVEAEGNLTEMGIEGLRQDLVRLLENRLSIDIAFANHPDGVTPSYRRFVAKRLQDEFDLKGVPIRIS